MKFEIIVSVDDEQKPGQLALNIHHNVDKNNPYAPLGLLLFSTIKKTCSGLLNEISGDNNPQEKTEITVIGEKNDGTTDNDGNDGQDSDKTIND